jgi:flagellar hook protein FlgE
MMRALFSAIAGLQNHITFMDVVGNNIANVNTQGYKASRVTFQDMLSQTLTGASAPTATRGGVNPSQVGAPVERRTSRSRAPGSSSRRTASERSTRVTAHSTSR